MNANENLDLIQVGGAANKAHLRGKHIDESVLGIPMPDFMNNDCDLIDESDSEIDIDEQNKGNIKELAHSAAIIFDNLYEEEKSLPYSTKKFLQLQTELVPKYREKMMTWLISLNLLIKDPSDTLFNAVTFLDILFSQKAIRKDELQLYGIVCYCIASKVETRRKPTIKELNAIAGTNYTKEMFIEKELEIVSILNGKLTYPTIKYFMRRFLEVIQHIDSNVLDVANMLAHIGIKKFAFLDFSPSVIACSAVALTTSALGYQHRARKALRILKSGTGEEVVNCIELLAKYGKEYYVKKCQQSEEIHQKFLKLNFDVDLKTMVYSIMNSG